MSESSEKLPIKETQINESDKKLPIEESKASESSEKLPIKELSVSEPAEKLPIEEKLPIKISVESYTRAYRNKGYSHPTIQNLKAIYDDIEVNQVFGSNYLVKILECSERTARGLLAKLREMNVVITVTGIGKGRGKGGGRGIYRFKYEGEE